MQSMSIAQASSETASISTVVPRPPPGLETPLLVTLVQRHLLNILDALVGPKTLVLGHEIAGILGLVVDVGTLKSHGVDKLYYLEKGAAHRQGWARNVVYLCRTEIQHMRLISG
jgi:vacuolar protein sorting-associated protein 33A